MLSVDFEIDNIGGKTFLEKILTDLKIWHEHIGYTVHLVSEG